MCQHSYVYRRDTKEGTIWACSACDLVFVMAEELREAQIMAQAASVAASDILVRVLSAIYHHRDKQDKEGIEPDDHLHKYGDDGRCTECGFSPFIGADRQLAEEDMAPTGTGEVDA